MSDKQLVVGVGGLDASNKDGFPLQPLPAKLGLELHYLITVFDLWGFLFVMKTSKY